MFLLLTRPAPEQDSRNRPPPINRSTPSFNRSIDSSDPSNNPSTHPQIHPLLDTCNRNRQAGTCMGLGQASPRRHPILPPTHDLFQDSRTRLATTVRAPDCARVVVQVVDGRASCCLPDRTTLLTCTEAPAPADALEAGKDGPPPVHVVCGVKSA